MEVVSTDIHGEKKTVVNHVQPMLVHSDRVSEIHFRAFWISKNFSAMYIIGIPHGDSELAKQFGEKRL